MKTSSFFHKFRELILGVFMLALGSFYFYHSTLIKVRSTVKVSAKLIPEILGVLVIVLGVIQVVLGVRYFLNTRKKDVEEGRAPVLLSIEEKRDVLPITLTFILITAYAMVFERLGFVIASTLCMFFQMLILAPSGKRKPLSFFVTSVVVAFVVYVAFRKGLNLTLPPGLLVGLPI